MVVACVAWRFWLGALSNKGGRGQRNREEIGVSRGYAAPAPGSTKPPCYAGYSGGGSSKIVTLLLPSASFPPLPISCHSPLPEHLEQAKTITKSSSVLFQIEL